MTPPEGSRHTVDPQAPEADGPAPGSANATELANLAGQVERLTADVERLENEKADIEAFAAVAAHELVEPLVMIEAYAAMAADRLIQEEHPATYDDLDEIGRAAGRLRRLAETLLHDARSGGRALRMRAVDCNRLVSEVIALLRPEIDARGVRVDVGALPSVRGESALLGGLLTNLLSNALKYGPRTGGVISVTAERSESEWQVSVEDDGPPITEDERAGIFEPFRRGRRERRARGAGLGLAVCRRIVERHGGQIGVAAGDRGGNRFFFTLPA